MSPGCGRGIGANRDPEKGQLTDRVPYPLVRRFSEGPYFRVGGVCTSQMPRVDGVTVNSLFSTINRGHHHVLQAHRRRSSRGGHRSSRSGGTAAITAGGAPQQQVWAPEGRGKTLWTRSSGFTTAAAGVRSTATARYPGGVGKVNAWR